MKHKLILILAFATSILPSLSWTAVASLQAQPGIPASGFVDPQAANSKEEQLYASATDAVNNGKYDEASKTFGEVAKMRGRRADGALYWKAYALNKAEQKTEALTTIAELRKGYPQSRWLHDAGALEIEIRGPGNQANLEGGSDEELKLLALSGLMHSDPDKALPLLEKVLQGNSSFKLKDKALFVLSQSGSEKAQQILLSIAKGNNQPELQRHAVRWLGINGAKRNGEVLQEIYSSSSSPEVKKSVLSAFMMSGDKERVLNIAKQETSPELKKDAIRHLGMMGAKSEIQQLYKTTTDPGVKETLLQSMGMLGDAQTLSEVAKTETDPKIRAHAIRALGMTGSNDSKATLLSIYGSQADLETKKEIIRALSFTHGSAKELIDIARKETNPELKKELVRMISFMHSPEATEFMMEILNK
jgi:HEAT repeat protein